MAASQNGLRGAESDALRAGAAATLEARCAHCHQAERLQTAQPTSLLLNLLDLDETARDPSLVRPGLADASPLYTIMLRQAMPPREASGGTEPPPAATDEDIQAVRDWINSLPPPSMPRCARTAPADDLIAASLSRLDPAQGTDSRFVFLPCTPQAPSADQQRSIERLVQHLSQAGGPVKLEAVDPTGTVFRFSLSDIGMNAAAWEDLVAAYPDRALAASPAFKLASGVTMSAVPGVRGDWLAHMIVRQKWTVSSPLKPDEIAPLSALARAWERDLDLEAAATEMALDREDLARLLTDVPRDLNIPARRLLQGLLPRADFLVLRSRLIGSGKTASAPTDLPADVSRPFSFALWSDKIGYATGELLTLKAYADTNCYLTLIALDTKGQATVLFPNETATDNLVKAGTVVSVPGTEAAYQLRLDKPGPETVIGVCTVHNKIADNIRQDFDRQRFTLLGDWRSYLFQAWKLTATPPTRQKADRRRRRGRALRRSPPVVPAVERPKPEHHARTAITFEVR